MLYINVFCHTGLIDWLTDWLIDCSRYGLDEEMVVTPRTTKPVVRSPQYNSRVGPSSNVPNTPQNNSSVGPSLNVPNTPQNNSSVGPSPNAPNTPQNNSSVGPSPNAPNTPQNNSSVGPSLTASQIGGIILRALLFPIVSKVNEYNPLKCTVSDRSQISGSHLTMHRTNRHYRTSNPSPLAR